MALRHSLDNGTIAWWSALKLRLGSACSYACHRQHMLVLSEVQGCRRDGQALRTLPRYKLSRGPLPQVDRCNRISALVDHGRTRVGSPKRVKRGRWLGGR
jgi:hypothetical protein